MALYVAPVVIADAPLIVARSKAIFRLGPTGASRTMASNTTSPFTIVVRSQSYGEAWDWMSSLIYQYLVTVTFAPGSGTIEQFCL